MESTKLDHRANIYNQPFHNPRHKKSIETH